MGGNAIPVAGDGFRADVHIGERHLRLFSEIYLLGHVAVVYDVGANQEISRQDVDNLDQGKHRAEQVARDYLKQLDNVLLPEVNWVLHEHPQQQ
jgi:hypothetical protein